MPGVLFLIHGQSVQSSKQHPDDLLHQPGDNSDVAGDVVSNWRPQFINQKHFRPRGGIQQANFTFGLLAHDHEGAG